jgi:hypothetical protein
VKVKHFRPFLGNDIDIGRHEKRLVLPIKLPKPSLDTVSDYCVTHLFARGKPNPSATLPYIFPEQQKMRRVHFQSAGIELQELRALAQAFTLGKYRVLQAGYYFDAIATERR